MEILAVEIRRYGGDDLAVLVPRVIGQTAEAQARKRVVREKRQWDRESFLTALGRDQGEEMAAAADRIFRWAIESGLRLAYGEGATTGTAYPMIDLTGSDSANTLALSTWGRIEFGFRNILRYEPYVSEEKRHELRQQLNAIPGFDIPDDGIDRYPSVPLRPLLESNNMEEFLAIWDQYVSSVRESNP